LDPSFFDKYNVKQFYKSMDKLIGITVGLKSIDESLWVNGIKLNAAMLYLLINRIDGYKAILVDTSGNIKDLSKIEFWDTSKFITKPFSKVSKKLDLLIQLGTTIDDESMINLRKNGFNAKVIKYQCGNNYVLEMERIIFGESNSEGQLAWTSQHDETWYVPQQHKHNHDYYSIISGKKAIPVPFVWDPYFIDLQKSEIESTSKSKVHYQPGKNLKKIISFEPNHNVVKYSMPLILLAEHAIKQGADFETYKVCSGKKMFSHKSFLRAISRLDIYKKKKIQYLGRLPITRVLTTEADIVLSHQWDNPLNYLYLDVMHFGYPLIHNADMVQDAGYFYKDFNLKDGGDLLKEVIENHDSRIEEYRAKNEPVLNRYKSDNPVIIETYKKLLDNLFIPEKYKMSYEYDWKTNTYKHEN